MEIRWSKMYWKVWSTDRQATQRCQNLLFKFVNSLELKKESTLVKRLLYYLFFMLMTTFITHNLGTKTHVPAIITGFQNAAAVCVSTIISCYCEKNPKFMPYPGFTFSSPVPSGTNRHGVSR